MNRDNSRKYPRSVESRNSFLRIRAPENLDIALEGLIRKVLKEQPKMDDIYAFAADYFDMLLKIREKSGIKKLSAQDICQCHNEEDAHEMVKLASSFAKRTKPHSHSYRALTLKTPDKSKYRRSSKKDESEDSEAVSKENESSDRVANVLPVVVEKSESEKTKNEPPASEPESADNEIEYSAKVSAQDVGEEVIIKANEVVTEFNMEEDSPRDIPENIAEPVGDINELRDKIKAVENEVKLLDSKESKRESEVSDEGAVGGGSEKGGESGNLDENYEESKLGIKVEDAGETGRSVDEELQVKDISVEADTLETQESKLVAENADALDEKPEEQGDATTNTGSEESKQPDIDTETKDEGMATQDVTVDAAEKAEETETVTDMGGEETQTEVEEVKPSGGDDVEKLEETGGEETQTDVQEVKPSGEDDVEKVEEVKTIKETGGEETQTEVEEVKPSGEDDVEKVEEAKQETETVGEETQTNVEEVKPSREDDVEKVEETGGEETQTEVEEVKPSREDDVEKVEETGEEETQTEVGEVIPSGEDDVEKVEEAKQETETFGEEMQTDVQEVKSSGGDEVEKDGESSPEKHRTNDAPEENPREVLGQDEALQEKEKEIMGGENPVDEKVEAENFVEEEKEAVEIQNSDVDKTDVIEKQDTTLTDDNSEVREVDAAVTNVRDEGGANPEEAEKVEKEDVGGAGDDINVSNSIAPVILGSISGGMEKDAEAPVEKTPSAEEMLPRNDSKDPDVSTATEIEKFLDNEREHSNKDKKAMNDENSVESEIVRRAVSQLGTIKENEELLTAGDGTTGKLQDNAQKTDDLDPDNHEGSTTSDEIEFEVSPVKYQESDTAVTVETANVENDEIPKETRAEPEIILELDDGDQKSEDRTEKQEKETNKALLEVPQLILDENIVRKPDDQTPETEPVVEEPEDEGIPECGNVGNEIIQRGEVEKVELVEGEEDILKVHLKATIETENDPRESVHVEMTSRVDPEFRVSVETRIESPVQDPVNKDNMKLIRAAVVIQNGFRRFKKRKISEEEKQDNTQLNNEHAPDSNENESTAHDLADPGEDTKPAVEEETKQILNLGETRTLVETQSLDSVRKISPLKTRSLSSIRHGVADFEVWNQLVKELEAAATKIQSNYRGYKSRKRLKRENAVQSTTITSEDSCSVPDTEISHRHTGEFHDTLVLPLDPK